MDRTIPVYEPLADALREKILTQKLKLGEKIPGENALAEEFGISRMSVRKAIKILISEELLEPIQGKGVFVTSPTKARNSRQLRVGLVNRFTISAAEAYHKTQNTLCERLNEQGVRTELFSIPKQEGSLFDLDSFRELDGVVWLYPNEDSFPLVAEIAERTQKPIMLFHRELQNVSKVCSALYDNELAVRRAVELLLNYNHRDILFLYRGERQYNTRREKLFKKAMKANGRNVPQANIIDVMTEEDYAEKAAQMIRDRKPDALFFAQGAICADILFHLYKMGVKIPEDMSVITFNNTPNLYDIELTHIDLNEQALATLAADYFVESLKNPEAKNELPVLKSSLVLGDSCKAR